MSWGLESSLIFGLVAAIFANPIYLEGVARREVVILAADFLFELSYFLREKFHGTPAFGADHVVMAAAVVLMLVTCDAVVKGDLAGESAFGQKFEGAVHRGVSDVRIFFLDKAVKFVGGKVIACLEEGAKNGVPLGRLLEADTLQVPVKDILGLADHLARDRGLVVDAFLEHGGAGSESGYHRIILKMKFIFSTRRSALE